MIILWTFLISSVVCHEVVEPTEDTDPGVLNTTTLYAVGNKTEAKPTIRSEASWKIETAFAESNFKNEDGNITDSKERQVKKPANESEVFRPSPHLGSFLDEERLIPTRETFGSFTPVIKKPPTGFINFPKDSYKPNVNKIPKETFKNYNEFPYKLESPILTRARESWRPAATMETRPTAEVPVRVPAGGLYQFPDAFREKPISGHGEDFGLEFNEDVKENSLKRRANPWHKLLHLMTALIPVGLIISALSPSVLTLQTTDIQGPAPIYRRADSAGAPLAAAPPGFTREQMTLPVISERCRRRLLCELHSDYKYIHMQYDTGSPRRGKQCHRLRCEEPQALAATLRWLLTHHRPGAADTRWDHFT